jgi:hypothetical protein
MKASNSINNYCCLHEFEKRHPSVRAWLANSPWRERSKRKKAILRIWNCGHEETKLTLKDLKLTSLPEIIWELQQLKELDLGDNRLRSLPEGIGRLKNLTALDLYSNCLSSLPDSIGQLQKLEFLTLYSNCLSSLPDSIGQLRNLKELDLDYNCLSSLPDSIGQLQSLWRIDARLNSLQRLPDSLGQLQNLSYLNLRGNPLQGIPESLGQNRDLTMNVPKNINMPEKIGCLQRGFPQSRLPDEVSYFKYSLPEMKDPAKPIEKEKDSPLACLRTSRQEKWITTYMNARLSKER